MTSHWLKSLWPVLLSGAQLARETERNGSCTHWAEYSNQCIYAALSGGMSHSTILISFLNLY